MSLRQSDAETSTRMQSHEKMNQLRHRFAEKMRLRSMPLLRECLAEFVGTMILICFGCGVLAQVIVGDRDRFSHGDFMSISLGWGMAVTMGVYFAGGGGPGLINPAVTLAFAVIGKVKFQKTLPYMLSQLAGAFFGSLLVYAIYYEGINLYAGRELDGHFLLNHTGKIFVTMPGEGISNSACFADQIWGTFLLCSGALAITDKHNWNMPGYLHPFMLGFMVFTIVGAFGINAGAALNPARDLGPRIMISMCGWGSEAFSHNDYFFWVPILGPFMGAVLGAIFYEVAIGIHLDNAGILGPNIEKVTILRKQDKQDGQVDKVPDAENQQLLHENA